MSEWVRGKRRPRAFEPVVCLAEDGQEYHGLCWIPDRGDFVEPITNRDATPVIGAVVGWRYPEPEPESARNDVPSPG